MKKYRFPDTQKTRLPEDTLVQLRAHGHRSRAKFIDPYILQSALLVIQRRGEEWVSSVLGRTVNQRSRVNSTIPALYDGEQYTLLAADRAEDKLALDRIPGID